MNLVPGMKRALLLVLQGEAAPLAGSLSSVKTDAVAVLARCQHVVPVGGQPPIAGVIGTFGHTALWPKELDILRSEGADLRLAVGAFPMEQLVDRVAYFLLAVNAEGEPLLTISLRIGECLRGIPPLALRTLRVEDSWP